MSDSDKRRPTIGNRRITLSPTMKIVYRHYRRKNKGTRSRPNVIYLPRRHDSRQRLQDELAAHEESQRSASRQAANQQFGLLRRIATGILILFGVVAD